jgi:citrate lyase subunit beta/citryl-CoA lyase
MLFVSGEKAERFPKAMAAGADVVCIDLEDAVHKERKQQAREQVLGWLCTKRALQGSAIALRINGLRTVEGLRDVLALIESEVHLDWLLVPKVEDAADLQALHSWAGHRYDRLTALIETPRGVENALSIAYAGGKLAALMLGGADLAAELGAQFGWDGLLHARGRLVNASKAAGLQAWDVPHIDLKRPDDLGEETRNVVALGFSCKTAIHPQQIPIIHAAFAPSPDELAWAKALLQAMPDEPTDGAFIFEGRMVDAPVLRKARRVVELSCLTEQT